MRLNVKDFCILLQRPASPCPGTDVWPPSQCFLLPIPSFTNCVGPSWHCISRQCCISCCQTALCVGLCAIPVCPCSFGDRRAQFQCSLETSSASGAHSGTTSYSKWDSFPVPDQNCCPHLLVMWITPLVTQCSQSEGSRLAGTVAAAQLRDLSSQWQLHLGAHLFAVQILQVVKPQTKCPSLFFSWETDVKHCKQLRQWPERAGVDVINWLEWVLGKNFLVQKIKSPNI